MIRALSKLHHGELILASSDVGTLRGAWVGCARFGVESGRAIVSPAVRRGKHSGLGRAPAPQFGTEISHAGGMP